MIPYTTIQLFLCAHEVIHPQKREIRSQSAFLELVAMRTGHQKMQRSRSLTTTFIHPLRHQIRTRSTPPCRSKGCHDTGTHKRARRDGKKRYRDRRGMIRIPQQCLKMAVYGGPPRHQPVPRYPRTAAAVRSPYQATFCA